MDRRDFLRRMALTGGIVATSQLPAFADDGPGDAAVFAKRGGFERLSMSYATVEIGLRKPFSVLHISDTHLTAAYPSESQKKQELRKNRTQTFGGHQEEALRDSLAWAKQHVDYVVHTGDLIDWQSEANYDLVRKYFGDSIVGCMGNHEFSPDMWLTEPAAPENEAFKDRSRQRLQEVYPFDISFFSREINGVNFITLDDVYATVTEQQVSRFKKEADKGLPIVLCMHVPLFTDTIYRANRRFWGKAGARFADASVVNPGGEYKKQQDDPTTRDFIAYLRQLPLLKAILCGHLHITVQDRFSPTATEYVVGGNFLFHGQEVLLI